MTPFVNTMWKVQATVGLILFLVACASKPIPVVSGAGCGVSGPIENAREAERQASCHFRAISEACIASGSFHNIARGSFHNEVIRTNDTWEIRSVAPTSECTTWIAILSAKDGHVIKFEPAQ